MSIVKMHKIHYHKLKYFGKIVFTFDSQIIYTKSLEVHNLLKFRPARAHPADANVNNSIIIYEQTVNNYQSKKRAITRPPLNIFHTSALTIAIDALNLHCRNAESVASIYRHTVRTCNDGLL